jgi:hypothetical protein
MLRASRSSAIFCSDVPSHSFTPLTFSGTNTHSDDEEEIRRFRNGEDLRYLPLIDRKLRLYAMVPNAANVFFTATI